jgi:hypothetical protein
MRLKHNKKRNTGFLFETLTREYVKSIIKNNVKRQRTVKVMIKENFSKGTPLHEELAIYREVMETKGYSGEESTRILKEAKSRYQSLDKKKVFNAQNRLIKQINYELSSDVFSNFVPNYKDLATVYNLFNNKTSIKEKVLLENRIIESLQSEKQKEEVSHVDHLTYRTFVNKFNEKYSTLPPEQRDLLTNYIASFADDSLGLKNYLNEHIGKLKSRLTSLKGSGVLSNEEMEEKYSNIVRLVEGYANRKIDDTIVTEVLKIQDLVRELENVEN